MHLTLHHIEWFTWKNLRCSKTTKKKLKSQKKKNQVTVFYVEYDMFNRLPIGDLNMVYVTQDWLLLQIDLHLLPRTWFKMQMRVEHKVVVLFPLPFCLWTCTCNGRGNSRFVLDGRQVSLRLSIDAIPLHYRFCRNVTLLYFRFSNSSASWPMNKKAKQQKMITNTRVR